MGNRFLGHFISLLVVGVVAISGCNNPSADPNALPSDVNGDLTGIKTDTNQPTQRTVVSEQLNSDTLIAQICVAIADAENWQGGSLLKTCAEQFDFTVTEILQSTLFNHMSTNKPITMEMAVTVFDPANTNNTWNMKLHRALDNNYNLIWIAKVIQSQTSDEHAFIIKVQEDAGEYPDFANNPTADSRVKAIDFSEIPSEIQKLIQEEIDFRSTEQTTVILGDGFYGAIIMNDLIIGYIVEGVYAIDNPLFDGGGVWLFFDKTGRLVTEQEWMG